MAGLDHTRRRRWRAATVGVLAASLVVGAAPMTAAAALAYYANGVNATEFSIISSGGSFTIKGGEAYTTSGYMRIYTQTIVSGVGIYASSYADGVATANLTHLGIGGAQQRCFWDFLGGTVAGSPTLPMTCARRY